MDTLPGLTTQTMGRRLIHLDRVDSTNDYLKENANSLQNLTVVMADRQTRGKGSKGRSWESEPGDGLYMSVLVKDADLSVLSPMPLVVALGVRDGLEHLCGAGFRVKWSNDVLHEGKKVCGILCESRLAPESGNVIVGIGVNLRQSRETLDHLGLVYASSLLLATDRLFSPKETAAAVCNALESVFLRFFDHGFTQLREEYRKHCVTLGRQVKVTRDNRELTGVALDIGEDGSLICDIDGQIISITAGEATIRGMAGYSD